MAENVKIKWYHIALLCLMLITLAYFYGNHKGKRQSQAKHAYKETQSKISDVYKEKEVDNSNVSTASKNSVKQAIFIRNKLPVMPNVKDTTFDYKTEYIKKFKP